MTVVVTGAGGFIGRSVVRLLRERGDEVHPVPHRWSDLADLRSRLPARIDHCLHLGWYAEPADYLTDEEQNARSVAATVGIAEELLARGCSALVVAGTSAEYRPTTVPVDETDVLEPLSVYGRAKVDAHAGLRAVIAGSIPLGWARIFNVTGPGEHPGRLLPRVARAVLAGERMELTSGEQVRDFLHVDDVAAGLVAMLNARVDGPVNVSSGVGFALRDVLLGLAGRLGDPSLLVLGARMRGAGDPDHVVGDNSRLRSLGWSPAYTHDQMLDATADYWRSQSSGR